MNMMRLSILLGVIASLLSAPLMAQTDHDLDTIRQRVTRDVLRIEKKSREIMASVNDLRPDGSWPGINYKDTSKTAFQHRVHLEKMLELARAFRNPASPWFGNAKVKNAASRALDHWLKEDYICENWWWNEIGTPEAMIHTLLVMDDALTEKQRISGMQIARRAGLDSGFGARPGGDLIKIAGLVGKQSLFRRDTAGFSRVVKVIAGEIRFSTERGLKPDYSFHHRTDGVISTLSYGLAYPSVMAYWAERFHGTRFRFPDEAMHRVIDYYIDGICKSMAFASVPDIAAKNRGLSRSGALHPFGDDISRRLLKVSTHRAIELKQIADIQAGARKPDLAWNVYFPWSEYASHQRPAWFSSVRLSADRQKQGVEFPYNEESLKMHHLADGANYIQITGKEYLDIFPVWDWQKIPGTTNVQRQELMHWKEIPKTPKSSFAGSVSDGIYGAVSIGFMSQHDPLQAHKSWFFFRDGYVSLGAGIRSDDGLTVATTVNQCLLDGPVTVGAVSGIMQPEKKETALNRTDWVYHGNVFYLFPDRPNLKLFHGAAEGSWRSITHQDWATGATVTRDVFKLWFEDNSPKDSRYAYIVVPVIESARRPEKAPSTSIVILQNEASLQAAMDTSIGIGQSVFHKPGKLSSHGFDMEADKPCMVMWTSAPNGKIKSIYISDPSRKSEKINIKLNGQSFSVKMPDGVKAGSSVQVELMEK
jgi:chondroitin AC lyase